MVMRRLLLAIFGLTFLGGVGTGRAQTVPFGKNKIQYSQFDWQVLSGEHADVYFYPQEESLARLALVYAEETYAFLEQKFQHHPFRKIPLIIYSSHQHFEQTNVSPGFIPEGVAGFTEFLKRRVALPFNGSYADFRHTLRHELVHAFQLSKLSETFRLHSRQRRASLPLWWTEGLAEYWSSPQDTEDQMFIRDLVLERELPTLPQLTFAYGFLVYPLGGQIHHYLAERFGEEHITQMYEELWRYDSFEDAFRAVYGISLAELDREWRYAVEREHFPLYAERPPLKVAARPIIEKGGANFKPAVYVAPGDTVAQLYFLSPRTGYTNIYRTTLREGDEALEVVVQGERSAEFESFHAYDSRIAISRQGVIAFVSKFQERDALFLWDIARQKVVGRYGWRDLVALQSPAWDPTGTRIVFAGLSPGGVADLYMIDFRTHQRSQITADRYDDEDPDWSPDGRFIVFASDRTPAGATGATNLFLYDVEARTLRYLTYGPWRDQDPRWAHDGKRIVFTSDRSGLFELYTISPDGHGQRVSQLAGAAFDPVWLPGDGGIVFTGFSDGSFGIYQLQLTESEPPRFETVALALPDELRDPVPASDDGSPYGILAHWTWGELSDGEATRATPEKYRAWNAISLDFASGDAIIAPGVGSAQGVQFLASDMLGDRIVFAGITAIQAESFQDFVNYFSGQLIYLNLAHRLNYGAALFRFKGLFRDVSFNVYEEENYGGYFIASYPFSKFRRLELQLGVERSDRLDREDFYRPDRREDPRDLTRDAVLTTNFLSYVHDNTLWLPTGPIDGSRYNLTGGLVTDLSQARAESYILLADYRRYFRTGLYSALATRAYVYYSDGAIPGRAVLGGPHRLRGYPRFSLAGSRLWLLNSEWRFPLLHRLTFGLPIGDLTFPGIQGATFVDIGSSWLENSKPEGTWGSYGLGFRMSLGWPLVLRLDVGRRYKIGEPPPVYFGPRETFGDTFVDFFIGFNY